MNKKLWQPQTTIHAISFDCDGTLSNIEGIDELAALSHTKEEVAALTHRAMNLTGLSSSLYEQRLALVKPTLEHTESLADLYWDNMTVDCQQVIEILQRLNKEIYIISAGNNPAVSLFGRKLSIPQKNIFAIDIFFDAKGNYSGFDKASALCESSGKVDILKAIKQQHQTVLHIGDGLNDTPAVDTVTRFIGYGGHCFRDNIAQLSPFYLTCESLCALLPLALTQAEADSLTAEETTYYQAGTDLLQDHLIVR
jgi:phosphoserine phosphatase